MKNSNAWLQVSHLLLYENWSLFNTSCCPKPASPHHLLTIWRCKFFFLSAATAISCICDHNIMQLLQLTAAQGSSRLLFPTSRCLFWCASCSLNSCNWWTVTLFVIRSAVERSKHLLAITAGMHGSVAKLHLGIVSLLEVKVHSMDCWLGPFAHWFFPGFPKPCEV